jgi:hypothetical protein
MQEHAGQAGPTVLRWSSYAIKAKPFDFPVALSRTRFMSTISPYLRTESVSAHLFGSPSASLRACSSGVAVAGQHS